MRDIVPEGTTEEFFNATMHLVDINDYLELIEEAETICEQWPMCQSWLDWWVYSSAGSKLFKARRTMPQNAAEKIPDTTNAQEAMHRYYYMATNQRQNSITGKLSLEF